MTSKGKGILATVIFHTALLLLLYFLGFSTPLPLPAEEGILVNFGTSSDGWGALEPGLQPISRRQTVVHNPAPKAEETPMTQDVEEAPSIPIPPKPKAEQRIKKPEQPKSQLVTPDIVEPENPTSPEELAPEPEPQPVPKINKKALFPGKKAAETSSSGEGETGRPGNQGSPDGSVDSPSRLGGGKGGGGSGMGISANLNGRVAELLPQPKYPRQKAGKVVVRVTVDRNGRVTKAEGGKQGSTTNDEELIRAAEAAARLATFNVKADAPAFQVGTITYHFRLK